MNPIYRYISIFIVLIIGISNAAAQSDTLRNRIIIDQADSSIVENINQEVTQYLYGNVSVYQDSMFLFCDRATLNENVLTAVGNVGIVQADTLQVYADSLIYYGNIKVATFFNNVTLDHGPQKLYTDYLRYDVKTRTATYRDTALMTDGDTKIQSLRGSYLAKQRLAKFRDQVIVIDSSFTLRSDSLDYLMDDERVIFLCPTAIQLDTADIYCEGGYYDLDDKFAMFTGNAQYRKELTKAVADTIYFDQAKTEIRMVGNSIYLDEDKEAIADEILFKDATDEAILIGNASFQDSTYEVTGDYIYRSGVAGTLNVIGRSFISNPPMIIVGDSLDYNENSGQGLAIGQVEWKDTSANVTIYCDRADYNDQEETIKATGKERRPLMENVIDEDTLFLAADTLFSFKEIRIAYSEKIDTIRKDTIGSPIDSTMVNINPTVNPEKAKGKFPKISVDSVQYQNDLDSLSKITAIDTSQIKMNADSLTRIVQDSLIEVSTRQVESGRDTARLFAAYPDVRIYKSDMQAVCDSLIYNDLDSIFYLYKDPVMWSDSTQFVGDTVHILLKNKKIDKVKTRTNSFITTEIELDAYDQIKGRNTIANFIDGDIDDMEVIGSSEAIYYVKDDEDGSYIGMNKTVCSRMRFFFEEKELDRIDFYEQPTSLMTPIQEVNPVTARLDNFDWKIDRRPMSLADILEIREIIKPLETTTIDKEEPSKTPEGKIEPNKESPLEKIKPKKK